MLTKTFPARVKTSADGLKEGEFEALVSVFGNVDYGGDRVMPGAYDEWLAQWKSGGNPLPVVWSHLHSDLNAYVGEGTDGEVRDEGLVIRGAFDLEDPSAKKVYRLLKGKRVNGWSFAYDVLDGRETDDAYELHKLWVHEIGPCLLPMNPEAQTLAVKSEREKRAADKRAADKRAKGGGDLVLATQQRLGALRSELDSLEALVAELMADELGEDDAEGEPPKALTLDDPLLTRLTLEELALTATP